MEFKHIEYFIETSRYTSMSKAAESLYISQQALSKCIAGMEKELGTKLFERSVKGIRLTEDGRYLRNVFAPQIEQFHSSLRDTVTHFEKKPINLLLFVKPFFKKVEKNFNVEFSNRKA